MRRAVADALWRLCVYLLCFVAIAAIVLLMSRLEPTCLHSRVDAVGLPVCDQWEKR